MKLVISGLKVSVENPTFTKVTVGKKEILKGIDLKIGSGELHVLMGPNGSGKSTLAQAIMGNPSYTINDGRLTMDGKSLARLSADKRARLGLFMAFQHPVEIPGVSVLNVLRRAKLEASRQRPVARRKKIYSGLAAGGDLSKVRALRQELVGYLASLKLSENFISRPLNEGFSGGEKKRSEILQMMALKPKLVILDEIDSGLDVDGLKLVAGAIKNYSSLNPQSSVLLITHYARILKYLKPDFVHVMVEGKVVKSGRANLAQVLEQKGYQAWQTV